jgi:hypothetical protein
MIGLVGRGGQVGRVGQVGLFALRTLEFDRIVEALTGLALTPLGADALGDLVPSADPKAVAAAVNATTETTAYLENNALFPLRAGDRLEDSLVALRVEGQLLEPLPLRTLADFVDSVEIARASIHAATGAFPILTAIAARDRSGRRRSRSGQRTTADDTRAIAAEALAVAKHARSVRQRP